MNRTISVAAALAALCVATTGPVANADEMIGELSDGKVQIVDFRGAPPFRRTTVDVSTLSKAELERLERVDAEEDVARVAARGRVAGNRGKPPYRRDVEPLRDAAEDDTRFARFEEEPAGAERSGRRGPPGKRFPFRHR